MKMLLSLSILMFSVLLSAQDKTFPKTESGEPGITEIVSTDLLKDKMYSNFRSWLAVEVDNYKDAIQFEDQAEGRIVANLKIPAGRTSFNKKRVETDLSFTIIIDIKDNKYRYEIKDILAHGRVYGGGGIAPRFYNDTPDRHFKHIEQYQEKITILQSKNTPSKEELADIEYYNSEIEREKSLYNTEYDSLVGFIESMKKNILSGTDF